MEYCIELWYTMKIYELQEFATGGSGDLRSPCRFHPAHRPCGRRALCVVQCNLLCDRTLWIQPCDGSLEYRIVSESCCCACDQSGLRWCRCALCDVVRPFDDHVWRRGVCTRSEEH